MNNALWAVAALFIFASFRKRKPSDRPGGGQDGTTVARSVTLDHIEGLRAVLEEFGADIARKVERVYRLETDDFTSGGYKNTGAAGQKAVKPEYPFGWTPRGTTPEMFNPVWHAVDNAEGGNAVAWVSWRKASDAMRFLAKVLMERGGNMGAWNSTNPERQRQYNAAANAIEPSIVNSMIG